MFATVLHVLHSIPAKKECLKVNVAILKQSLVYCEFSMLKYEFRMAGTHHGRGPRAARERPESGPRVARERPERGPRVARVWPERGPRVARSRADGVGHKGARHVELYRISNNHVGICKSARNCFEFIYIYI